MNYLLKQHGGVPRGLDVQADTHANGVQLGQVPDGPESAQQSKLRRTDVLF